MREQGPKRCDPLTANNVIGRGPEVFKAVAKAGGEGINTRNPATVLTQETRSGSWLKIKTGPAPRKFSVGGPSSALIGPGGGPLLLAAGRLNRENGVLR